MRNAGRSWMFRNGAPKRGGDEPADLGVNCTKMGAKTMRVDEIIKKDKKRVPRTEIKDTWIINL